MLLDGQVKVVDFGTGNPTRFVQPHAGSSSSTRTWRAGTYYTPYLAPSAMAATAAAEQLGHPPPTAEDVLRNTSHLRMEDVPLSSHGTATQYQHMPELGFYCMYRKRAGENGISPDCQNITHTATRQAAWMSAAGLDYTFFDHTNFNDWHSPVKGCRPVPVPGEEGKTSNPCNSDWLQLRPTEVSPRGGADIIACSRKMLYPRPVLIEGSTPSSTCGRIICLSSFHSLTPHPHPLMLAHHAKVLAEEWSTLRAAGYSTPELGTFTRVTSINGTTTNFWAEVLERLYNTFPDLAVKHRATGKKIFIYGMATNATTDWNVRRSCGWWVLFGARIFWFAINWKPIMRVISITCLQPIQRCVTGFMVS
jgi:hypothetical protein